MIINDIPDIFRSQDCHSVSLGNTSDDLVILSESESGLQCCLQKLADYTKKWKLNINLKKSKCPIDSPKFCWPGPVTVR
ncbi:hypothetical protein AC249_AIPGENE26534 [Exaiptasia diaphana]|nr:hypothetical protein AC249_AIPGENE26534 [Exaiptasia diaphana]